MRIQGYGAVFNSRSENLGGFFETIDPKAFDRVLRTRPDVLCLFNHSDDKLLGRTASGTVQLSTDSTGLRYVCDLPNTPTGEEVGELVQRGDISTSSFGFICSRDDWNFNDDGTMERRILEVSHLLDVSPVTSPAYPATSVGIARHAPTKADSPEDAKWKAQARKALDALQAGARSKVNTEKERMRMQLEASMVRGGIKPETARAIAGSTATRGAVKATRTYRVNGKIVTRAQYVAYAKSKGVDVEKRLSQTVRKAERIAFGGAVEAAE